jgi:hypothetical protein
MNALGTLINVEYERHSKWFGPKPDMRLSSPDFKSNVLVNHAKT